VVLALGSASAFNIDYLWLELHILLIEGSFDDHIVVTFACCLSATAREIAILGV
jgi:hypothetical protein